MSDFTIYAGEESLLRVAVNDQDGNDKNLTGATVTFRIGDLREGTSFYEKAGTIVDGATGIIQALIVEDESEDFILGLWDYQFIVVDSDGTEQIVKSGEIQINRKLPTPT